MTTVLAVLTQPVAADRVRPDGSPASWKATSFRAVRAAPVLLPASAARVGA